MYLELHASSAFSFLEGASTPEALVERAAALGYPALALLDRDGVYGAPRFHLAAKDAGIKAIVGSELTIRSGASPGSAGTTRPSQLWRLPVLVASRDGYRRLCRMITRAKLRAAKGEGVLTLDDLDGETGGLIALVGRAAVNATHYGVGGLLDRVVGAFGRDNVYVELQRHFLRDQESDNQALAALAAAYRVPIVATNGVRFASEDARPLFDVLTCARHGTTVERAGTRLAWNAERFLKPRHAMTALFADLPEAIASTRTLADRLQYTMADLGYRFPDYPVPEGETQASFLRRITEAGARDRYRPYHDRARAQVTRELDLIEKLQLAGYFLIVWDIVNFCRQHGILVQGRGSAANSAVCYSLGITAVDPVGMDLLFERFLSAERGEWPDIDLDLPSGDRREQVIQYVYRRYGALGAAMTANVITYRGRSAAREVGKALGLDDDTVDRLAKAMTPFEWRDPAESLGRHLADAGFGDGDPRVLAFADLWRRIQDLPRHLGQHSGGMVVCQGRLDEVVPLEPASMPGRVVIQWDKEDCADMGIVKVDLLGLGMMAVLQDALTIVNGSTHADEPRSLTAGDEGMVDDVPAVGTTADDVPGMLRASAVPIADRRQPIGELFLQAEGRRPRAEGEVLLKAEGCRLKADDDALLQADGCRPQADDVLDLAHLPPDDPEVYRMLQEADTSACSRWNRARRWPRCRASNPPTSTISSSRWPSSGQVRSSGRWCIPTSTGGTVGRPSSIPHPSLEPILKRTLGVPLFQEQLLRMAMVAAGFSGGEAEELRRAMGFKRSEERMKRIETRLRAGMARNGIEGDAADGIVRSIVSFALYGFPESHAASFALIVYASAYLKAHYPGAFYTALLNNQPMGFYHPATLVKDAQRRGVRFAPIDVQRSDWPCRVEQDGRIRLGLMYVRGLREEVGRRIAAIPVGAMGVGAGLHRHSVVVEAPSSGSARASACAPRSDRSQPDPADVKNAPHLDLTPTGPRCPGCGTTDGPCSNASRSRATSSSGSATSARAAGGWRWSRHGFARWITSSARQARAETRWRRWRRSARSTRSAMTGGARCGRSSAWCGRRGTCTRKGRISLQPTACSLQAGWSRLSTIVCRPSAMRPRRSQNRAARRW